MCVCVDDFWHFPGISRYFLYFHVFPSVSYWRFVPYCWHAATKAPTGRNTCSSEGSTVSEVMEGCQIQFMRVHAKLWKMRFGMTKEMCFFCTKQVAISGLRFGCSLVTRSTQPSVLPCRASCSRKKWTISSLTATRSRGRTEKTNISKKLCKRRVPMIRNDKYRPKLW